MRIVTPVVLFVLCGAVASAEDSPPPALRGFDPVALCESREKPGAEDRELVHGSYRYLFESDANRERFRADPERWGVQWAGACGRMGPLSGKGDPDRWLVHDGRVYLFASEDCRSTFVRDPSAFLDPDAAPPEGTDATRAEGLRLVERAVEALGGAKRLDALKSWRMGYEQPSGSPGLTISTELVVRGRHDVRRHRTHGGRWPETHVLTAEDSFVRTSEGVETLHESARRELRRLVARSPLVILSARKRDDFRAVLLGEESFAGAPTAVVDVGFDATRVVLLIEKEKGHMVGMRYRGRGRGGAYATVEERLSDWREVGGLRLPHHRDLSSAGAPLIAGGVTVKSYEIDPQLPDALFRR